MFYILSFINRLIAKEMAKLHCINTNQVNPKSNMFDKLDKWIEFVPETSADPALPSRYRIPL